jgi:hypothetical protein
MGKRAKSQHERSAARNSNGIALKANYPEKSATSATWRFLLAFALGALIGFDIEERKRQT